MTDVVETIKLLIDIGKKSKMKELKQLTFVSEIPCDEMKIDFIRSDTITN